MKIVSFSWTSAALLAGQKTVTRRVWKPDYAATFRPGDLVQGYERSQRLGGMRVAIIRITSVTLERGPITDEELGLEGITWSRLHVPRVPDRFQTWDTWLAAFRSMWELEGGYRVAFDLLAARRIDVGQIERGATVQHALTPPGWWRTPQEVEISRAEYDVLHELGIVPQWPK